jgi:flagellar hook-length control protein FliK
MPLAPNVLLQATPTTAASKTSSANHSAKLADNGKDDSSSFSDVYAKQAQAKSATSNDVPVKARPVAEKDKSVADKGAADKGATAASDQTTVADSGNTLPAEPVVSEDDSKADEEVVDPTLAQVVTPEPTLDPALDPALQALASQAAAQSDADKLTLDTVPAAPTPALSVLAASDAEPAQASFDPNADPLDDMPALQFALESAAAKTQQTQNANHASASAKNAKLDSAATDPSQLANNLAALDEQLPISDEGSTDSGDKSFDGLLDSGLKDVKGVVGDTRMDNFADRLAALSQAAQQARTATPAVPLINQPLAMHQSGWSEGVVDRVMYLSSQNLKSADIQLEPAELGRLDIRINMAPDQQTQVTFMSAHIGVREALESQMSRLRESFNQQGLGQVDVNVSDQSRNQQNQAQQQEQANNARGTGNGGSGVNGVEGAAEGSDAAVAVSQPVQRVVGTSEIDYYA